MRLGIFVPIVAVLLVACSGSQKLGAENEDAPIEASETRPGNLAVPIGNVSETSIEPKSTKAANKPLVSRGTSQLDNPAVPPPAATPQTDEYRAIGTEPFWAATVRHGQLSLERPSTETLRLSVARSVGRSVIRYTGDGFSMSITPGPCSDGMSNAMWSDRVQIAFAEGTLKGCGGEREDLEGPLEDD